MYLGRVGKPPDDGDRPRLADLVLPRRHVLGVERVALHAGSRVLLVSEAEWRVASALDGTRDAEGVRLAAKRAGVVCTTAEVEAMVDGLEGLGMLARGVAPLEREEAEPGPACEEVEPRPAREVRSLEGLHFTCDGSGGCCAQYPSIALDEDDARRALTAGMRRLPDDPRAERTLMPFDATGSRRRLAMAVVEGRCLQLDDDGRCAIHRAGGAAQKPKVCTIYPLSFVDDGDRVRVSVGFECSCVFESARRSDDTDVLFDGRTTAELPVGARVRRLPEILPIAGRAGVPRSTLVAWTDALAHASRGADAVEACVAAAGRLVSEGAQAAGDPPQLEPILRAYADAVARADESSSAWRAESDRVRRMRTLVHRAASRSVTTTRAVDAAAEAFFLRAALFGLDLLGEAPLASALVAAAARLVIARHVDPSLGHPIAVVEATARGLR